MDAVPAMVVLAVILFAPQLVTVFLLAGGDPGVRQGGAVMAALLVLAAALGVAYWLAGGRVTDVPSYDPYILWLLAPAIAMAVFDAVAAIVTWRALPQHRPTISH